MFHKHSSTVVKSYTQTSRVKNPPKANADVHHGDLKPCISCVSLSFSDSAC